MSQNPKCRKRFSIISLRKLILKKFETILDCYATPFLDNLHSCETKDFVIGIILFGVAFSSFASCCTEAFTGGDAAVYLKQMKDLDFYSRSVHIGYYLLGAGFIRIFPGSDDYALNLMNCFFGAFSATLLYLITFVICHKRFIAIISGLFLLTHYIFIENSVYAEVYTPQVCFLLLAILFWLRDRPVLAVLSFFASFLMSTSTIFALPLFFILRPRLRPLVIFGTLFLVIAAAVTIPLYKTYFLSSRGLLSASFYPANMGFILHREAMEVFLGSFLGIPFMVVGLIGILRHKRFRPFAIALLALWLVTLLFGEKNRNDFPVQLPTFTLLCIVGALGFQFLLRVPKNTIFTKTLIGLILTVSTITIVLIKISITTKHISIFLPTWLLVTIILLMVSGILLIALDRLARIHAQTIIVSMAILVIITNGFIAFSNIRLMNIYHTGYRNTVIEMNKVAGPNYLVIGGWSKGILFGHYVFQKPYMPCWINTQWLAGRWKRDDAIKKLNEAITARRQIWLLGKYPGLFSVLQKSGYKIEGFRHIYVATVRN